MQASTRPVFKTPAQMVNQMTSRRRVSVRVCLCTVCTRAQQVTGTMDNKTFNGLFSHFPFQQGRAVKGPNNCF